MKAKRYEAGEYTTITHIGGPVPARVCGHAHKTFADAERCAERYYPWVVYQVVNGRYYACEDGREVAEIARNARIGLRPRNQS